MRAGLALGTAALAVCVAMARSADAEAAGGRSVTVAFLPSGTAPQEMAAFERSAVGLLSGGLGNEVPADQTYLDIGQGNRVFDGLYDEPLPRLSAAGGRVPPEVWERVLERARSAPADIEPGLLATAIERAAAGARAAPGTAAPQLIAANRRGRIRFGAGCRTADCAGMTVISADVARLASLVRALRGDDLLIAVERPPPEAKGEQLSIAIAGDGFEGQLTSDSTRLDGLVLSTDLAPTILERLGAEVPDAMTGEVIRAEGELDAARLVSLERRLAEIGPRRGPVIGASLVIWAAVAALAVAAFGSRGARVALPLIALAGFYVPAVLLLGAALEPSETVERFLVTLGCPILATATLATVRGYGAAAVACAVTVLAFAVDVVAGSPLTALSLIGPNPALGVRFFGIGNELEATIAALIPIGVGAWLVARGPVSPRAAVAAFAVAAAIGIAVFAPGRFGADVGAAIVLPIGAAVAAWVMLGGGRGWLVLVVAVPLLALAAVAAIGLVLGGDAHLSRSVLEAGGLDDLADVAERRLRLSADSFAGNVTSPWLLVCAALILAGVILRRRIADWFEGRRPALAGLAGAIAATLAGTLANDSGAVLLMIGTGYASLFVAYAWAAR